ncbi:Essential protein Yae1, N-terminal [Heracleum sosnowskyi]|uniref:Essential protein Yae1, N-terminal n=1 Tax=Heracleum sosnowskyi TaxID=360622 RepID=A0AAD8IX48_9APIA|nr:Essential protein Yae1, N-terminal [Heracleum sosnowskyi]
MTSRIADELYSESSEQSNGGMGSQSSTVGNSSDCLGDELWNEDGFSWNASDSDVENASDLDREWQSRRDQFHTIGYRDGLIAGKEASAQEGFNTGFSESVFVGYKWGLVRGVTSALASLSDAVGKVLVKSKEKRNKFLHLQKSVDSISTSDALKLFHDDLFNNVEKEKQCGMSTSHKDEEHVPGSNDNILETYFKEIQELFPGSPALEVDLETSK